MKLLSKNKALILLDEVRESFRSRIESAYETRAKSCLTCEVKGSCCTDAHFVNVHISRLEAEAVRSAISLLDADQQDRIATRNEEALESLEQSGPESSFTGTYSCPLFEKGIGCLVHTTAKPLPCINHACYERAEDLPPAPLLEEAEKRINRLNDRVYKNAWNWLPIPEWLRLGERTDDG